MKDIKGYEGSYAVTEEGQVWSYKSNKFLKPVNAGYGYLVVCLRKDGKHTNKRIHRLVAEAYLPNPEGKAEVNHKDEDKTNNCVANLEWVSSKENCNYGTRNKRISETVKAQFAKE